MKSFRIVFVVTCLTVVPAAFASDVFLDWDGAFITMASAWSSAGYGSGEALTSGEMSSIIAMSKGKMEGKFAGYTISFVDAPPSAPYEWMKLGSTTTSTTTYGESSGIDWRNEVKDGTADIYLANFGAIMSKALFSRSENISRFASAIANTASHELGHNLGLQHYDAYGTPAVSAPGYGFAGEQNMFVMATGVTGLTPLMRGSDRFFNPIEKIKLEFADGIAPTLGTTLSESFGAKDTLATAQTVYGSALALTAGTAVNIDATIDEPGQSDIYKFFAVAGSRISANTFSHGHMLPFTDTTMFLMDSTGAGLFSSTDIDFFGDDFMTGSSTYYSDDSLIFNYIAPYTGTYYMKITGTGPGEYDLLMTGLATVPEPGTVAAIGLGVAALVRRRKKTA